MDKKVDICSRRPLGTRIPSFNEEVNREDDRRRMGIRIIERLQEFLKNRSEPDKSQLIVSLNHFCAMYFLYSSGTVGETFTRLQAHQVILNIRKEEKFHPESVEIGANSVVCHFSLQEADKKIYISMELTNDSHLLQELKTTLTKEVGEILQVETPSQLQQFMRNSRF